MSAAADDEAGGFAAAREVFEGLVGWLDSGEAGELDHAALEAELDGRGRELLCQLIQDHLALRAVREPRREDVADADGVARGSVEADHERTLATIFGEVGVCRLAYRQRGYANLHPADAELNLPVEKHSHGLRRLAAVEATRGSFDDAVAAVERASGQQLGKRQLEALAARAAVDFDAFYADRDPPRPEPDDVVVLSCDGKGIVMRPDALRPATARAAAEETPKLSGRLSRGEKRNRKRMAEVASVYHTTPVPRRPADVLARTDHGDGDDAEPPAAPTATGKWLTASVACDAATVVADLFDEAGRRDPHRQRPWVALVDGNRHQIDRLHAEAAERGIDLSVIVDFVHVVEYVWSAAWCFFAEGDPDAETWVGRHATAILEGRARDVATSIRRKATRAELDAPARKGADRCVDYLRHKATYLDYPTALAAGWPIATGVIEGACRHLVKDRLDITGARWSLAGAEAILKLRALTSNGDFDAYWRYHLAQEHQRVHQSRYADNTVPRAA